MSTNTLGKLILIDGNALVHRAYHALPPLSHEGEPTNAVYGFTSVLLKVIRELKPEYMAATFDLAGPTFRHEEFKEYKAHRPKTPDDLVVQFSKVKEVVRAFGIPIYEKEGFEADDVIGTIAEKMKKEKVKCVIITGDLDTLQLVNGTTEVLTLKKGISDTVTYDEKAVRERFGLAPSQLADFKGLKGDPSDNIPGVPGVGDKTATELLSRFGSIENVFAHFDELPEKMRKKLAKQKDPALFSKSLATIRKDAPVSFSLADAKFGDFDVKEVEMLFKKFGFFTLISRLPRKIDVAREPEPSKAAPLALASASDALQCERADALALAWDGAELVVSLRDGATYCFSLDSAKTFLENKRVLKVGYDLKQLWKACIEKHIVLAGPFFDALVAAYLCAPGTRVYPLERVLLENDVMGKLPHVLFALKEKLDEKLREAGLLKVFTEVEMPLISVLAHMELAGIRVDTKKLSAVSKELEREKAKAQKTIWKLAQEEFNIDSPKQLSHILFEKLHIGSSGRAKKTKTGMVSTRAGELEKLSGAHPVISYILRFRELAKLKSTYADALVEKVDADGRVHTDFLQTGTATGRLASAEPNLQNLPQKGDWAGKIRDAFVAEKEWTLTAFDFSQFELRIIASLSRDEKMMRIFREGGDIHRATAAEVNNVPLTKVTPEMRTAAKTLNFGILYGMGPRAFAEAAHIDFEKARRFIAEYFTDFSGVAQFIEMTKRQAEERGYVQTLTGRKRWLPDIRSNNPMLRSSAERMAQNMPIQGLQADIIKIAMVRIEREVLPRFLGAVRLILQIHDELLFEVKNDTLKEAVSDIKRIMESAFRLEVPIEVGVRVGNTLGTMHPLNV